MAFTGNLVEGTKALPSKINRHVVAAAVAVLLKVMRRRGKAVGNPQARMRHFLEERVTVLLHHILIHRWSRYINASVTCVTRALEMVAHLA